MNREAATMMIRKIAKCEGKVFLTRHARERDPDRGKYPLTKDQILNCLCFGSVIENPVEDGKIAGGWKCVMRRFVARECHEVVAVFIPETQILVVTAYPFISTIR